MTPVDASRRTPRRRLATTASVDLLRDALAHRVVGFAVEPAGVDQHVRAAERPHVGVVPVAGDAWLVVHDGEWLARRDD